MRLHLIALGSALCIAASASAVPHHLADGERGVNGNGNGLGHAYGHFKSKHFKSESDLAESARSACWELPVAGDLPAGPVSSNGGTPRGFGGNGGFGDLGSEGSGAGGPRPTGAVSALPEPSGALLFGAGVALVTLRLRRQR